MKPRLAVVLFNLGGPDKPAAVRPFLFNLFKDKAIIPLPYPARMALAALISTTRAKNARANYAMMGGGSPLLPETRKQADALLASLQKTAPGYETKVFIAMRYWNPFTDAVARDVAAWNADEVVLLPLYPQYSTTTTGSSYAAWKTAYRGRAQARLVCCYPDISAVAEAHAALIRQTWIKAGKPSGMRLLFSAHGLPQQLVDGGDPYAMQVEKTCAAVVKALGAKGLGPNWDWKLCYQSRVGRLKWLGPYTPAAIAEAAEQGHGIIITPIAFVSEHVETLVELDHEYGELAGGLGVETYLRVPALGVSALFIDGLAEAVIGALGRDLIAPAGSGCSGDWLRCACREKRA
jgi:ferrochelatase